MGTTFSFVIGIYNPVLVIPTSVITFLLFSTNTFAIEEKGNLNSLYLTLPIKRSSIVAGRFILSISMGLLGIILGIPIMILVNRFAISQYYGPPTWYFSIITLSCLLFAFFNLTMFPILFKLGYSKGKFWGYILPLIFLFFLYGAYMAIWVSPGNEMLQFDILQYAYKNVLMVCCGMILLSALLLFFSYAISKKVYSKRDF